MTESETYPEFSPIFGREGDRVKNRAAACPPVHAISFTTVRHYHVGGYRYLRIEDAVAQQKRLLARAQASPD